MDYLARREHSEQELVRKLMNRGFDAHLVDAAVATLEADGLLSNHRFAEAFVHSRVQKGSGPQKIYAELRQRGIDDSLIDRCMEAVEDCWWQQVRDVRARKFGAGLPHDIKERNRQMRFLQQRGFTAEQIFGVFKDD
jgi:regulatory protein